MSALNKIRENWPQITVLVAALLILGGGYLEWRLTLNFTNNLKSPEAALKINELIDLRIAAIDIATDQKVVNMDTNIAANTATGARNTEEIDDAERRLEQAFKVLLGD